MKSLRENKKTSTTKNSKKSKKKRTKHSSSKKSSPSKHYRSMSKPEGELKYCPFVQAKEVDLQDNDSSEGQFNNTDDAISDEIGTFSIIII